MSCVSTKMCQNSPTENKNDCVAFFNGSIAIIGLGILIFQVSELDPAGHNTLGRIPLNE